MQVVTTYEAITKALNTVTAVLTDKMLSEDLQTIVMQVSANECSLCAGTSDTYCITNVETQSIEGEGTVNLPSKALNTLFSGYANLHTTKVETVAIIADDVTGAVTVKVKETPRTDDVPNGKETESSFRLQAARLQAMHLDMIKTINTQRELTEDKYVEVNAADILRYIKVGLASMPSDASRDKMENRIIFDSNYVTVMPYTYILMMKNILPDVMQNVTLKRSMAVFLKSYLNGREKVKVCVEDYAVIGSIVQLTIKTEDSLATLRPYNNKMCPKLDDYISLPVNKLTFNRAYFLDVLKRLALVDMDVTLEVNVGEGTCSFFNEVTTQYVTAESVEGVGEFKFKLSPDNLSKFVLGGVNMKSEKIIMCLEDAPNNSIGMVFGVTDETDTWHTKTFGIEKE